MRRRKFIALMSGVAAVWPLAAGAQLATSCRPLRFWAILLRSGTRGLVLSRTEWVNSAGSQVALLPMRVSLRTTPSPVAEIAAESVRQKVDFIVTYGGDVTVLKQEQFHPYRLCNRCRSGCIGLVANLCTLAATSRTADQTTDLAGQRLKLFRQLVPNRRRFAIILDEGFPAAVVVNREVQAAARTFRLEVAPQR